MKPVLRLIPAAVVLAIALSTMAAAQSQSQSLGDYARAARKAKPASKGAAKTYDNDNLPRNTSLSVVGQASAAPADQSKEQDSKEQSKDAASPGKQDEKSEAGKKPEAQIKPGQPADERQKALEVWKEKVDAQKDKVSLLSRELDVLQREHQLKQAEFYADTAARVTNPNGFADEDAKYKQQIADKQKALDEAKAKFEDIQDQARKAGAPNSVAE